MINKNGKAILKMTPTYEKKPVTIKNTSGGETTLGVSSNNLGAFMTSLKLYVGSGTTDETVDDYTLEEEDSDLSVISRSGLDTNNPSYTDNYIGSFTSTFKNNTENDITISEIGIIGEYQTYRGLIAREVITPVVINPGKTYTFSMTIG